MINLIKSRKGISLIEILVTLPLAALVFVGISLAIISFMNTYQETKLYTQIQEDLFTAVETMRMGYANDEYTKGNALIGLSSANSIQFSQSRDAITISPALAQDKLSISNYWSRFSCDSEGQLWVMSSHGLNNTFKKHLLIFPSAPVKMIGRNPQFQILNRNTIWDVQQVDGRGNPTLIKISLEAQVRFREKQRKQTPEDDLRQNTRNIKYETSIFVGNSQI
jgi:hypothetical protein